MLKHLYFVMIFFICLISKLIYVAQSDQDYCQRLIASPRSGSSYGSTDGRTDKIEIELTDISGSSFSRARQSSLAEQERKQIWLSEISKFQNDMNERIQRINQKRETYRRLATNLAHLNQYLQILEYRQTKLWDTLNK